MPTLQSLEQFPSRTERCIIRFFNTDRDIDQFQQAADNPRVAQHLVKLPHPYTREHSVAGLKKRTYDAQRLKVIEAESSNQRVGLSFCIEIDGIVNGTMTYDPETEPPQTISIGYWFAESAWGKGYATECVRWLVGFIEREEPWARRVEAGLFKSNTASRRVLEKCGFTFESLKVGAIVKGGSVFDEIVMARQVNDSE
ncbi:acyl-CoA N-acyltransferase [Cladochytrium replicatum]|nr:acyl-CoA N-acyltransferase [Cladochytrium replicatum]